MQRAQQLGRYQLLDRIAYGGMAEIYRAKTFDQEGRAHLVAVKKVLNHLTTDDEFVKMLVDEAKLTALLQHENVAQVYEFSHTGDEYFIAMEYVDGKDVRALLERHRQKKQFIPAEHVAWVVMEVANGLYAAHTQKDSNGRAMHIVHRDVSPSNVLLSYNGEVKLCDFGIAKATSTRVQTKTGVIKGKVKYMSPEQAMGRRLDHRSDLFSLGTVMYEMLALEAPFIAATEVELIFAVRDAVKRDVREINGNVPNELAAILERLMSRSRSQRFQSGKELALALRGFLDTQTKGYRRSHFGRYMRKEFADDIERELRQLEDFVMDTGVDPSRVGENLLADVMPANAIYTQFTAAGATTAPTIDQGASRSPDGTPIGTTGSAHPDGPLPDLHAQHTRILERTTALPTDLHALETRILTSAPQAPPNSVHDETTAGGGNVPLSSLPTKILNLNERPQPLHEMQTKILRRPEAATTPSPKVVVSPEAEVDEDEQTSVPLDENDLEEA
jgi:serine/threonine-protein kinase